MSSPKTMKVWEVWTEDGPAMHNLHSLKEAKIEAQWRADEFDSTRYVYEKKWTLREVVEPKEEGEAA